MNEHLLAKRLRALHVEIEVALKQRDIMHLLELVQQRDVLLKSMHSENVPMQEATAIDLLKDQQRWEAEVVDLLTEIGDEIKNMHRSRRASQAYRRTAFIAEGQ